MYSDRGVVMLEKLKKNNRLKFALTVLLLLLGVCLLVMPTGKVSTEEAVDELSAYKSEVEGKLEAICHSVCGGGEVVVTFSHGFEYVYATDSRGSVVTVGSGSSERPVIESTLFPEISGVGVVCGRAIGEREKNELIGLISTSLGIGTNKIFIIE